jgi:hypothetical protein
MGSLCGTHKAEHLGVPVSGNHLNLFPEQQSVNGFEHFLFAHPARTPRREASQRSATVVALPYLQWFTINSASIQNSSIDRSDICSVR